MSYQDSDNHRRRSTRLRNFDYGSIGWYFVTICTFRRELLFGEIDNGELTPSEIGRIVIDEWELSPGRRPEIDLDAWVLMPNHLHGIVIIKEGSPSTALHKPAAFVAPRRTLGSMIGGFKAAATKSVNLALGVQGISIWQRGFYDHIIRDDRDLDRIRTYISNNPANWLKDDEYRSARHPLRQGRVALALP